MTDLPAWVAAMDKLIATVVLPLPPFCETIAQLFILLTGSGLNSRYLISASRIGRK
jgi:hypothetical protein